MDPVRMRGTIKTKLTRFENYLVDLAATFETETKLASYAIIELRKRLADAELLLGQFENYQLQVEESSADLDSEYTILQDFESRFYKAISQAEDLLQKATVVKNDTLILNSREPSQADASSSRSESSRHDSEGSARASVIREHESKAFVKLPTINLPTFDGKPDEWLNFRDLFSSLIDTNEGLTDIQKLHYLRASLAGKALEAVKGLNISSANYTIAWSGLNDRFNNSRALIHYHIKELFGLENVSKESSSRLRSLVDSLKRNMRSLDSLIKTDDQREAFLMYLLQSKLDVTTNREFENQFKSSDSSSLDELISFVEKKASLMETVEQRIPRSTQHTVSRSLVATASGCPLCGSAHALYSCNQFKRLDAKDRQAKAKQLRVCLNCLTKGHFSKECKSLYRCRLCRSKHNSLLHIASDNSETVSTSNQECSSNEVSVSTCASNHANVLLSTAVVNVLDSSGKTCRARILLDSGSQSHFITERFADRLGLKRERNKEINVMGLGKSLSKINSQCAVKLISAHSEFSVDINCFIIPVITGTIPNFHVDVSFLNIPSNIQLADPDFGIPDEIDILVGATLFYNLICPGRISLGKNQPCLQKTCFGWIASGNLFSATQSKREVHCNLSTTNLEIQDQLARFWEVEEVPSSPALSQEEIECETQFKETVTRDSSGRFVVSIPFKGHPDSLGDSLIQAKRRFYNLEKRLNLNPALRERYVSFMHEYEALGHMDLVLDSENLVPSFYLPHHGVLKESSLTTKLRVVFDGSARTSNGISLNDIQKIGPVIQSDLFSILVRFRKYEYAFSTDIEKMYRQVKIVKEHRPMQRILWRSSPEKALKKYELNTITYGTASASFLATRCLFEIGFECSLTNPDLSRVILRDFYIDDCLSGSNSLAELQKMCVLLSTTLASYGFPLRKWLSNNPSVLESIEASDIHPQICDFGFNAKTLGLLWSNQSDTLLFSISETAPSNVTKRTILSDIAQIFDPLGLLSPCTMIAKFMLQALWLEKISWDDPIPSLLLKDWLNFRSTLPELNKMRFTRNVVCRNPASITLHAFSDASVKGYGACIYVRSVDHRGEILCHLLCAKGKVAPLKYVSIPRMELCGALLLARLLKQIMLCLEMDINKLICWTDSTIVLSWLKMPPNRLKTFVANRISEIQELTKDAIWKHVPSKHNPSDLISRGVLPSDLIQSNLWVHGPDWLGLSESHWPNSKFNAPELPELKVEIVSNVTTIIDRELFLKFSSLLRLKRVVAFCFRFRANCTKTLNNRQFGALSPSEINDAMQALIKVSQSDTYANELNLLKNKRPLNSSKLSSLNPFLDQNGLIRVGGRIRNSSYEFEKKHPFVISGKHPLARLIFVYEHSRLLHAGPQLLLSAVREKYWITSSRNLAKRTVHACVKCFRFSSKTTNPIMGDLPSCRVDKSFPFQHSGVDYAGPFLLKDRKGRGCRVTKCYICLFVCLATKAVHLELVSELTAECFIQSLRRFVARRGYPSHIYSDNGTNFVGANSILKELGTFLKSSENDICDFATESGMFWHFIPSHSPHFGGLWEAGIKSCKHHLRRVAGNASLTFEEFGTLLAQIESVLNSRPLTPVSSESSDLEPLTPGHFLIGRSLLSVPDPDVSLIPQSRLSRFQFVQQIVQHFWKRWSLEYISELQQRSKWRQQGADLKMGALVIIKQDNLPPIKWQLGRVIKLYPGKDGVNRVADIKTAQGIVRRSFAKICPLPIDA